MELGDQVDVLIVRAATVLAYRNPVITPETGTVQLTVGNLNNKKFPARIYTPEGFPSLAP